MQLWSQLFWGIGIMFAAAAAAAAADDDDDDAVVAVSVWSLLLAARYDTTSSN